MSALARLLLKFDLDSPGDGDVEVPAEVWAEWIAAARQLDPKPYQLGVIACSKSKRQLSAGDVVPARHLYTGQLFKASLEVAEKLCDRVIILSALHGVVAPEQLLETYDKKLPTKLKDRVQWGLAVDTFLPETQRMKVLCLAPEPYWSCLPSSAWEKPLKGLGIGEQKAKLAAMAVPS